MTLIARDKETLAVARKEVLSCSGKESEGDSRVGVFSVDVTDHKELASAVERACKERGTLHWVVCNAGSSKPDFLENLPCEAFRQQVELNYLGLVHTFKACHSFLTSKSTCGDRRKIVCISSALGLCGMAGYSAYCPTKWAVRGFCETLRNELQPFAVDVHVFHASSMDTPGYKEENLKKPAVTKKLEEGNVFTAEQAAGHLFEGLRRGDMHVTSEWLVELLLVGMTGVSQYNNLFLSLLLSPFMPLIAYAVKSDWDSTVKKFYKESQKNK